jgi:hypothetical protein
LKPPINLKTKEKLVQTKVIRILLYCLCHCPHPRNAATAIPADEDYEFT